eukprot:TRINITY_DN287_c0_g3_i1.p1 TRINITY_DN287_c0_g3~~TRINITY_DN287_c0_g3_i1.p1  ORF type:complete len:383 (+),score=79.78 TRINITY_DN287_c0_g3_i1:156-1304(+)
MPRAAIGRQPPAIGGGNWGAPTSRQQVGPTVGRSTGPLGGYGPPPVGRGPVSAGGTAGLGRLGAIGSLDKGTPARRLPPPQPSPTSGKHEQPTASNALPAGSGLAAAAHGRRVSLSRDGAGVGGNTWPGATARIGDAALNALNSSASPSAGSSPQCVTRQGRTLLPPKTSPHPYTVVFDLDETLVSNRMAGFRPAIKRPHLDALLKSLKGKAELVLWTASIESVGRPVLRQIDPNGEYFDHAIFRDPAWFQERPGVPHTKDLRLLGRDLSKVIIVENNPFSVRLNKRNAVLVPDFDRPNPTDGALKRLEGFLGELLQSDKEVPEFVTANQQVQPMRMMRPYGAYGMGGPARTPGAFGARGTGGKVQEPYYYLADGTRRPTRA